MESENLSAVYGDENEAQAPSNEGSTNRGISNQNAQGTTRPPADQSLPEQRQPLLPQHRQTDGEPEKQRKGSVLWTLFASIFVCAEECSRYWNMSRESMHGNAMKQSAAKHGFFVHWLTTIAVFVNMIDYYIKYSPRDILLIALPVLYVLLGTIFGWYLWIRPMLQELSREAHFNSCYVHMVFGFHFAFCAFMLIGYPDLGAVGIMGFQKGVLGIIDLTSWVLVILWSAYLWKKVQELGE